MHVTSADITDDHTLRELLLLGPLCQVQVLGTHLPLFCVGSANSPNYMVQPRSDKGNLRVGT